MISSYTKNDVLFSQLAAEKKTSFLVQLARQTYDEQKLSLQGCSKLAVLKLCSRFIFWLTHTLIPPENYAPWELSASWST